MKNSFKQLNKKNISKIEEKANILYDGLKSNAFKDYLHLKCQNKKIRNKVMYKYINII